MKRVLVLLLILSLSQTFFAQIKFRYGITAGLNISSAILPELKLNTDINSILRGENVVKGNPQLADFVSMYKAGIFVRLGGKIVSLKFNIYYDKTKIHQELDALIFTIDKIDIDLSYIDFDTTINFNLFKNFYFSAGYIPSFLLTQEGNWDFNTFEERVLTGFGIRFKNGMTLDLNAIMSLTEIIDGSYIHNFMIPVTINIPLN